MIHNPNMWLIMVSSANLRYFNSYDGGSPQKYGRTKKWSFRHTCTGNDCALLAGPHFDNRCLAEAFPDGRIPPNKNVEHSSVTGTEPSLSHSLG